jgi:endoglucanase
MSSREQQHARCDAAERPLLRAVVGDRSSRRAASFVALALSLAAFVSLVGFARSSASGDQGRTESSRSASANRHPTARASRHRATLSVRVRGNELVNAAGNPIRLVGLNRSGSQYMCVLGRGVFDGPTSAGSIAAMRSWHINAVRVPVNEDCWLGINGVSPELSGSAYRSAVESYVAALNHAGLYVILDVHWNAPGSIRALGQKPMLDASHGYELWGSIARAFRGRPAVLFDLYNEPHNLGVSPAEQWQCWAAGCGAFAGMDGLVSAIRAAGARNVIIVAGLAWASNDSRWLEYEPQDPLHNLAAGFHVYRAHTVCATESCWNETLVPLSAQVPVVDAEFGEMQCGNQAALAWLRGWMSYATVHGFSMLAWSWNAHAGACSAGPSLISEYNGTPTPYGEAVRAFFLEHEVPR